MQGFQQQEMFCQSMERAFLTFKTLMEHFNEGIKVCGVDGCGFKNRLHHSLGGYSMDLLIFCSIRISLASFMH